MTLIFIPKTIETVEEAEALPDGTMARKDDFDGWIDLAVKGSRGWARVDSSPTDRHQDDAMIGFTALIPVEAEEETRIGLGGPQPAHGWGKTPMSRLTTPWREA